MFLENIKITRLKILIAKILYRVTKIFYQSDIQIVKRNGLILELNLREGIDLHVFLFGGFQKHVYENKMIDIKSDDVIFDVGGNVGIISLLFAKKIPNGKLYSFEPTYYAFNKFVRNLELNPDLESIVELNQCFVSSQSVESSNLVAYSSWPVGGSVNESKHEVHCGVIKDTNNIPSVSIDDFVAENRVDRIDLIKIDTDGHEYGVLKGCEKTLESLRPQILMEVGIYIMKERQVEFNDYFSLFQKYNYSIYTTKGKKITNTNYAKFIPEYGTIDVMVLPD
jgi:methyltransferase, FkbM family